MLARSPMFATVPAHDFERAKRWYADKLGLTPFTEMGPGGAVYAPGGVAFMIYETEFAGTGKHTIATIVVDDIDKAMAEMRAKGVVFEEYSMGDKGPNTVDGVDRGDPSAVHAKDGRPDLLVRRQQSGADEAAVGPH